MELGAFHCAEKLKYWKPEYWKLSYRNYIVKYIFCEHRKGSVCGIVAIWGDFNREILEELQGEKDIYIMFYTTNVKIYIYLLQQVGFYDIME